ncbi:MAG: hypothetical protein J6B80_01990 [Clostridia bacterium]|nr:hypothetical protein [Clostridia bacterium]
MNYYQFEEEIAEILQKIGIPKERFNIAPGPIHFEGYYYNILGERYIYAYFERGNTTVLIDTNSYDDFKYSILRDIVKKFSIDYELKNRLWYQDTRRIWMDKSKELMAKIDSRYCEELSREYNEVLIEHPFDDETQVKMNVLLELYKVISKINISHNLKLKRNLKAIKSEIKKTVNCSLKYDNKVIINIINKSTNLYKKIKSSDMQLDDSIATELDFVLSMDLNFLRDN